MTRDACGARGGDVDGIATVVVKCGTDVETGGTVGAPGGAFVGVLEAEDLHTWWCDRFVVEVVGTVEGVPGGNVETKGRRAEKVKG